MFLAEVTGTLVTPVQHPSLEGRTQLLLRPLDARGKASGRLRIAVDIARAGVGDRVLVIDEGNSGRQLLNLPDGPIKTIIVGVVDYVELENELVYDARQATACSQSGPSQ